MLIPAALSHKSDFGLTIFVSEGRCPTITSK